MVPIIVLLVMALAGSIYLCTGSRNGSEAGPRAEKRRKSHAELIANGVHSAAARKVCEPATPTPEDEGSKFDGFINHLRGTPANFEGLPSKDLQEGKVSPIFPFRDEWKGWLYVPEKVRKVTVDDIIFNLLNLSQLPSTNVPVLYEINRYDSSASDVARAIENDWNLAARILKLANSAFYSLGEEVTEIRRAITLLGFDTVRSLIYLSAIYGGLEKSNGPITSNATFLHCLAASCATQYFSQGLNQQARSLVATAGLFHDIGKVLCSHISKIKTEAAFEAMKGDLSFDRAQLDSFGVSHYLMTAILLDLWHFPHKLTNLLLDLAPGAPTMSPEAVALKDASMFAAKLGFEVCHTEEMSTDFTNKLTPGEEEAAADSVLSRVAVFYFASDPELRLEAPKV